MTDRQRFDWESMSAPVGVGIVLPAGDLDESWSAVAIHLGAQGRTFAAHILNQDNHEAGPLGYGSTPQAALRSLSRSLPEPIGRELEDRLNSSATVRLERHSWTVDIVLERSSGGWSARLAGGRYDPTSPDLTGVGQSAEQALHALAQSLSDNSHWRSVISDAIAVVRQHPHWL